MYPQTGRVRQNQTSLKQAHDWHAMERTLLKGETVYASNFRRGPKWIHGVLKQSTSPTSFLVQLEDRGLLRRHQDHLIQRSSVLQTSISNREEVPIALIPASVETENSKL